MEFQLMATASFVVGLIASTLGGQPVAAGGAFVGAGLFAIASAIATKK